MSEQDWSVQVSLKTKSGTLINLRGNTEEEMSTQLDMIANQLASIGGVEQLIGAMENIYNTPASGAKSASIPEAVTGPSNSPSCVHEATHGPMVRREGVGARGPWGAWFCPTPKGTLDQCAPVFDKRSR
jgi:hypothetical protein